MFPTKEVSRKIEEVPYTGGTVNGITKHSKGLSLTKENFKLKITNNTGSDIKMALTERVGKDILSNQLLDTALKLSSFLDTGKFMLITEGKLVSIMSGETEAQSLSVQSLTPGVTIDEFVMYVNSGSIQLSEIKVESQNNPLQTTQNFQISTFRPWNRPAPQILNVSALKNQDSENRYVVGPFEVPGSCILSYRSNLEYTVLAGGDEPNVVIIDLFFSNDTEHADISRNLLAQ